MLAVRWYCHNVDIVYDLSSFVLSSFIGTSKYLCFGLLSLMVAIDWLNAIDELVQKYGLFCNRPIPY